MEQECCQIKITKIDNGYRFEVTGENLKENLKENCDCIKVLRNCCCTSRHKESSGTKSNCGA